MSLGPWVDQDGFDGSIVVSNPTGSTSKFGPATDWFGVNIRGNQGSRGHGVQQRIGGDLSVDDPATSAPDGHGDYPATWEAAVHGAVPGFDPYVDRTFSASSYWSILTHLGAGPYMHPSRTTKWWADGCGVDLQVLTWQFQFFVDQDPDLNDWPDGAIDVEYEGPCILSDVAVSMDGTDGEIDNQATILSGFENPDDYYIGGLGSVRLVPGQSTDDDEYILDALATYPDSPSVSDLFSAPVDIDPLAPVAPESYATAIPDQYTTTAPSVPGALGDRYGYYFLFGKIALTVSATVVRPRYRFIFEGGSFPLRRYPPVNNGGSGPTRHWPRTVNRRAGGTY